jgi:hypothetical protein
MTNARDAKGKLLPGSPGRPKGARNKLSARVIDDILKHWSENGAAALDITFKEKPAEYVRAVLSVLPKEFVFDNSLADLGDEQIDEILEAIRDRMLVVREKPEEKPDGTKVH